MSEQEPRSLKRDLFGRVDLVDRGGVQVVRRDTRQARFGFRLLAIYLASREAKALRALDGVPHVPQLVAWSGGVLDRSWIPGQPMQSKPPQDVTYFRLALRLVCRLHRAGVVHNDLAKEPNWLVDPSGSPALVDFQLAWAPRRRGRLFRLLAREDLRHMLKHKRTYHPRALRPRELAILASPSWAARLWARTAKRLYLLVTRGLFGWSDREGAGDRVFKAAEEARDLRTRTPPGSGTS